MPRPRKYKQKGDPRAGAKHLLLVCGVSRAAQLFNVSRSTIYYHIQNGNIAYSNEEGFYKLSIPSLIAYYNRVPNALKFLEKTVTV